MKTLLRNALWTVSLLIIAGCATYPMGLSKSDWEALPPERRAELRIEENRRQEEARIRREEAAQRQREEREAAERERRQALAERRAAARYRDIVVVTLQGGALLHDGRRYELEPRVFELIRGERMRLQIVGHEGSGNRNRSLADSWSVGFSEDGHTVTLNDSGRGPPIVLVDDGTWEQGRPVAMTARGQHQSGAVDLVGMTATIRYKDLPGAPQRLILERR